MKTSSWLFIPFSFAGLLLYAAWSGNYGGVNIIPLDQKFSRKNQSYAFIIPSLKPVRGAGLLAKDCGACHKSIYKDWKKSTHAQALSDLQFQSELGKKSSPKWVCLNCHIPVQNQRPAVVVGLQDGDVMKPVYKQNHSFNKKMQEEAISCATCHIRADATGESFIIGPNGSTQSPHPVRKNKEALQNVCERCHTPRGESLTSNLTCWFDTHKELGESRSALKKTFGKQMHCVDCHMPSHKAHLANDFTHLKKRNLNQHFWSGSGIPKRFVGFDTLLQRGYKSGLEIKTVFPRTFKLNQNNTITVRIQNKRAGHSLPTGDPERFIKIMVKLKNKMGKIVSVQNMRIGQTWQWSPARKLADNRLKYKEIRSKKFKLPKLESLEGVQVQVVAIHMKVTKKNMKHLEQGFSMVDENLLPHGKSLVKNAHHYYPSMIYLHHETIRLDTGEQMFASQVKLIEMSKAKKPALNAK